MRGFSRGLPEARQRTRSRRPAHSRRPNWGSCRRQESAVRSVVGRTDDVRCGNRGVGISFTPSSVAARGLPDECQTTTGRRPAAQKQRPKRRANARFPWASPRPPMHLRRGIRPHPRRCRHSKPLASIAPQPLQNTEERETQTPWWYRDNLFSFASDFGVDVILGLTSLLSSCQFGFFRLRVLIQGVLNVELHSDFF